MNRFILFLFIILFSGFFCSTSSAALSATDSVKEPQKRLIEKTRDIDRQGTGAVQADDMDDEDGSDDGDQNADAVETDQAGSREESVSPLLNRDYLRQFDIPIVFNDAVDYFIRYFTVQKRKVFINWLKRAKRYAPMIRQILKEQGLPEDLVYLAMIESGFNPKAYSPMKACGPWQFIYETGERYGLRVNYWVDERRDPQKSTVAAARYLKDLFNQFGCWYLAAAGYNAGEKRIERAITKHETNDFWELSKYNTLPRETRDYIPQLIAAAVIAKDPERFGLTNIPFEAPVPTAVQRVPGGTPLALIAKAARFDLVTVHSLNPEILRGITPPDSESYSLRLPVSVDRDDFNGRLKASLQDGSRVLSVSAYTMKRKDSISRITKSYGVSETELMLVNACGGDFKIRPGSVVYIPRFERDGERKAVVEEARQEETEKRPVAATRATAGKANSSKTYHIVKRGESLPSIARRYGLDAGTLKEINDLKGDKIRPNTKLVLVSTTRASSARYKDETSEAPPYRKVFHIVKKGESLADISEKYGTDVATLKKINRLKKDQIVPNMKLEIAGVARTQSATEQADRSRPDGPRNNQPRNVQARPAELYHIVRKGENLTEISERYSVNVTSLKKMNCLKKNDLRPGMRLKVASR